MLPTPKADIVFDQFHVIQHLSAEVFKEARQVQAEEVEAEFGKKSDQANGGLRSGDAGTLAHADYP